MTDSPIFSSSGIDKAESASIEPLADVKVEEVDLDDSASDEYDEMTEAIFRLQGVHDIVTVENKRNRQQSHQPMLTLQSFARIPVLATHKDLHISNEEERQLHVETSGK